MNYVRKRASVACNFCRQRKRRCNQERPSCGLCSDSGVECEYHEPSLDRHDKRSKNDADKTSNEDLLRRLEELEALLRRQHESSPLQQRARPPGVDRQQIPLSQPSQEVVAVQNRQQQQQQQQQQEEMSPNAQTRTANTTPSSAPTDPPNAPTSSLDDLGAGLSTLEDPHLAPFLSTFWSPSVPDPPQGMLGSPVYHCSTVFNSSINNVGSPHASITFDDDNNVHFTIPLHHLTTTGNLFVVPQIRSLVGDYPADFYYQIESNRPFVVPTHDTRDLSLVLATLNLQGDVSDHLLVKFTANIHSQFPVLDMQTFPAFFEKTIRGQSADDCDTALCLVVLALGKLACSLADTSHATAGLFVDNSKNGMEYFSPAYHILTSKWIGAFKPTSSLPLGLVLASIYLNHLDQPLPAWKLVYMASSQLQFLLSQPDSHVHAQYDVLSRLSWTCFVLECDLLAEFHLPRSGIELLVDRMQFPRFTTGIDRDGLLFLALCSVRRLLNRIHHTIYGTGASMAASRSQSSKSIDCMTLSPSASSVSSMESVVTELARQLDTWYLSLPDIIKPDLSVNKPRDIQEAWLRLRYWSAKNIISRPCLMYAVSADRQQESMPYVLEYSTICIDSCRNYILTAEYVMKKRTNYTWMIIQTSLTAVFALTLASRSPLLSHLVPDMSDLLDRATAAAYLWATPDSSGECTVWIMKAIKQKLRISTLSTAGQTY